MSSLVTSLSRLMTMKATAMIATTATSPAMTHGPDPPP
jgi:hypothetical protein